MPFLGTKEQIELLASRLETATYILTLLAAVAGISFLLLNRRLQRFTKAEFVSFQKTIVETRALSDAAKADAATARAQEEQSKTERARLELRIAEMEKAHSKLAVTNAENEQKIILLQEEAKPRNISPAQRSQIAGLLKPFAGQSVALNVYTQDSEAQIFAEQIAGVLQDAGLRINRANIIGPVAQGLAVAVHDQQNIPPLAGTIQHAFGAAGIAMPGVVVPNLVQTPGEFAIAVGAKPKTK